MLDMLTATRVSGKTRETETKITLVDRTETDGRVLQAERVDNKV